ncbi:MAG: N-acetylmuramic acid 6-phosphate etherase [Alphaproteobacteria bacterium]|nr:N-acetylmuramic acid 6-phosphate etherase [Alphaproteobacteria bacterium]
MNQNKIDQLSEGIGALLSESSNEASSHLDEMSPLEIATLMNEQDKLVAAAVQTQLFPISKAIEAAAEALAGNGRIIYVGAGTSGRLGILDASECPPTFGVTPDRVVALIAGGPDAMFVAQEGSEDCYAQGAQDLIDIQVTHKDVVIGLAVSGRTPYVLGAIEKANEFEATTVAITCNERSALEEVAAIGITPIVGAEILTGSTRLKSGSAQKMVLNMISTGAMVQIGKCYGNRMVDLKASNEKLQARALKLVREITKVDTAKAIMTLEAAEWNVKTSILMIKAVISAETAVKIIAENDGRLALAIEKLNL